MQLRAADAVTLDKMQHDGGSQQVLGAVTLRIYPRKRRLVHFRQGRPQRPESLLAAGPGVAVIARSAVDPDIDPPRPTAALGAVAGVIEPLVVKVPVAVVHQSNRFGGSVKE